MNYTNREVVKRIKQYDMFLSSLGLAKDENTRERICDQLDKIEKQILLETNTEYEEAYMRILNEEEASFEEEKNRLRSLINIIEERRKYLEERKKEHKKITGSTVELTSFLGENELSTFKRRLEIIETYERNKDEQEKIMSEMKALDVKISEASRNVKANTRLDDILENKMIELVSNSIEEHNLNSLITQKANIEEKHKVLEYALDMARENLKNAKELNDTFMIIECDNILSEITIDYTKYHEKLYTIELMEIYDEKCEDYNALFTKRDKMNNYLKEMTDSELYKDVNEELSKEYNTIKLQKQDLDTYESLKNERLAKRDRMTALEEQNNSKEFKTVLDELIKMEAKAREEKQKLAKKKEYEEKQERLLEEQKLEASRIRRQKLIEEAKMKEQQERLNKVKELQDSTIIGSKKKKKEETFDIKKLDDLLNDNKKEEPEEKSLLEEMTEEIKTEIEPPKEEIKEEEKDEKTKDLFKLNDDSVDVSIFDNVQYEEKEEDNKFDYMKDFSSMDDIPIIQNNNLKPELAEVKDGDIPKMSGKEGDILWKETL